MTKHQWKTYRVWVEHPQAQRRWDQVYQHLLRWSTALAQPPTPPAATPAGVRQEVVDASSPLCESLQPTPSPNADH